MEPQTRAGKPIRILLAACTLELCLGAPYGWSVFTVPLMEHHGWSQSQVTFAFSLYVFISGVGYFLAGPWADRFPRPLAAFGAVLFGTGYFLTGLASLADSLTGLTLGFGLGCGFGITLPYLSALAVSMKWFPHRKGLAAGVVIMGCGVGAAILGWAAPWVIERIGPGKTLMGLGVVFAIVGLIMGPKLRNPPEYDGRPAPRLAELVPWEVLRRWNFWGLWLMVFAAVTAGMAVISQAAPMAKDMHHLSPKSAGMLVAMMALANGFGRFFWPTLSDRVGRRKVVLFLYITLALMFLVLVHLPNPVLFGAAFCYVTMCYGGMFGTMPAFTADLFGHEAVGKMYGPVMSAVSVAGLVGPMLFSILRQHTAGYALPAQITAGLCIAACVLPFLVGRKK